ncbi:hypothetical protein BDQ17DRAFT_732143 [Cyathus striatus]|nr:hypothetical protein BDQ17DRAFT_732143 [Cyathus striatus]
MYAHPFYRSQYPSYNPYSPFPSSQPVYPHQFRSAADEQAAAERARALAAQRARRHQYLPDEDEDSADEWEYSQLGPRERAYLDAQRKRDILERMQKNREQDEWQKQQQEVERRWQQELDRRQKEAEAERARILEQKRRAQRQRHEDQRIHHYQERSRSPGPASVPINIRWSPSREEPSAGAAVQSQSSNRSIPITEPHSSQGRPEASAKFASISKEEPPRPQYDERHYEAASRIQQQYRIHRSYHTIQDIEHQFDRLKRGFTWPSALDFQIPGSEEGHITIPTSSTDISDGDSEPDPMDVDGTEGRLAYTSANYAFHQYTDLLEKLLVRLDGVESWGDKKVRERRRSVVKSIEMETQKLDRYWRSAWRRHLEEEKNKTQEADSEPEEKDETH